MGDDDVVELQAFGFLDGAGRSSRDQRSVAAVKHRGVERLAESDV
jgi:hypothetical protein